MRRTIASTAILALLAVGCRAAPPTWEPSPVPERPRLEVALVSARSGPSGGAALRAMHGARIAFDLVNQTDELPVVLMPIDYETHEDTEITGDVMDELAASPDTLAVIAWPGGPEAAVVREDRGFATLDLSPAGAAGAGSWARLVANDTVVARDLAAAVASRAACVVTDEAPRGMQLAAEVEEQLRRTGSAPALSEQVASGQDSYRALVDGFGEAGCRTVAWLGGARDAATLIDESAAAGLDARFTGTDRILSDTFLDEVGPAGEGTQVVCPCIDVTTRTGFEIQRFVQEYQSRLGVPPTTFAIEGWDAAQMLIDAVRNHGTDREAIAGALHPPLTYEGLGRVYEVGDDGESRSGTVLYEVRDGRWLTER